MKPCALLVLVVAALFGCTARSPKLSDSPGEFATPSRSDDGSRPGATEPPLMVGFLLLDGVYNSELAAPFDVFQHTVFHTQPGMQVCTIGRSLSPVTSFEGLRLLPDYDLDTAPALDVLVVPSAATNMDEDLRDRRLIEWIADQGKQTRYNFSVCDGAFLLAEAGLLDGRACTTYPGDIPAFRARYPHLHVLENQSFVADGPVITGAGGARSYDPAMYLVESLYGKTVARGIGRGLVIDWQLESIEHTLGNSVAASDTPTCFLPGDSIPPSVTVQDASGEPHSLHDLVSPGDQAVVLIVMAGAEGGDTRQRGGLWCEDSFNELPVLRHLVLDYKPRGVRFVPVLCPPVYHEEEFAYESGSFLNDSEDSARYTRNRNQFVTRSLALVDRDALPFSRLYFDPRFRLLANPHRGLPSEHLGAAPDWQGRFKWYEDTQTYGTPTIWTLDSNLRVVGNPFCMNVYESEGRKLRFTVRDIRSRLDRILRQ